MGWLTESSVVNIKNKSHVAETSTEDFLSEVRALRQNLMMAMESRDQLVDLAPSQNAGAGCR